MTKLQIELDFNHDNDRLDHDTYIMISLLYALAYNISHKYTANKTKVLSMNAVQYLTLASTFFPPF